MYRTDRFLNLFWLHFSFFGERCSKHSQPVPPLSGMGYSALRTCEVRGVGGGGFYQNYTTNVGNIFTHFWCATSLFPKQPMDIQANQHIPFPFPFLSSSQLYNCIHISVTKYLLNIVDVVQWYNPLVIQWYTPLEWKKASFNLTRDQALQSLQGQYTGVLEDFKWKTNHNKEYQPM